MSAVLPTFARDEPLVLFGRLTGDGGGIYVSRPDGTGRVQLATDVLPGVHKGGDWSPDGQRVVFTDETTERMYIAHLDGTPTERVAVCDTPGCDKPSWSPDGTRIAFSRPDVGVGGFANGPGAVGIYVVELATGTVSTVVRLERPLLADQPRWSPDSTNILFGVDRMDADANETGAAVGIVSVSGGKPRFITDFSQFGYVADWRPTSDEVVFSTELRGAMKDFNAATETWNLYVVHADGTGLRQLTKARPGELIRSPRWTPDGTAITAYDHSIPGGALVDPVTGSVKPFVTVEPFTRPMIRPLP